MEARLTARLSELRKSRRLSIEAVAEITGISRASLSRLERGETSPTASTLGRLCSAYGCTISQLMAEVESEPAALVRRESQAVWQDPESGFLRKIVSPPGPGLKGEIIEGTLPPDAAIDYGNPPQDGIERHLVVLNGQLDLTQNGIVHRLKAGDCLRFIQGGGSRFHAAGAKSVRYLLVAVRS